MDRSDWDEYCGRHGGVDKFHVDHEAGFIYVVEVFEDGAWHEHATAGTEAWALSKLKRLIASEDSRVSKRRVN